jgi:hypothetical protein
MTSINGFDEYADDLDAFAEDLREFAARVDGAVDDGVETTTFQLYRSARRYVPVDTNTLRTSIAIRRLDIGRWAVGTPVDYADDVEYGTAPHVITPTNGEFLYFEGKDGHLIRKRSVNHPGTPAQPFMRPALNEHKSDLSRNIANAINDLARRIF